MAQVSVRGALGSFLQLFITVGLLYSYVIGPYVSYLVFWILCAILPILFFVCFMTMPESPYYLLKIGQREEAIAALARLRSKSPASVQKEADEMQVIITSKIEACRYFSDGVQRGRRAIGIARFGLLNVRHVTWGVMGSQFAMLSC